MKPGDIVRWTYRHHLNSRSSILRSKEGVLIGITGKVKNKRYVSGSHAKVHFKGNKHPSIVPIKEIELVKSNNN